MKTKPSMSGGPASIVVSGDAIDDAVKAVFDAKKGEPSPDHLLSLVSQLDAQDKDETAA